MNSYKVGVFRDGREAVFGRTGTCIPTEYDLRELCKSVSFFEISVIVRHFRFVCYNDNLVYKFTILKGTERMRDDALATQLQHLFGNAVHSRACSCCEYDGRGERTPAFMSDNIHGSADFFQYIFHRNLRFIQTVKYFI